MTNNTQQIELWKGQFGDHYSDRNVLDDESIARSRMFWENILKNIYYACQVLPTQILEVGAGTGRNLMAIKSFYASPNMPQGPYNYYATEVNDRAKEALKINVPDVNIIQHDALNKERNKFDLVFTSGVLIHIHPAHRKFITRDIVNASRRFVLAIEYFAPETTAKPYRGENNAMWLDDYGSYYLDNYNLRLITYGFCWKKVTGLDNITYWLFEKIN